MEKTKEVSKAPEVIDWVVRFVGETPPNPAIFRLERPDLNLWIWEEPFLPMSWDKWADAFLGQLRRQVSAFAKVVNSEDYTLHVAVKIPEGHQVIISAELMKMLGELSISFEIEQCDEE